MIKFLRFHIKYFVLFTAFISMTSMQGFNSASAQALSSFFQKNSRYVYIGKVPCEGQSRDGFFSIYSNGKMQKLFATLTFSSGQETYWDLMNRYDSWYSLPNRYDLREVNEDPKGTAAFSSYKHVASSIVTDATFKLTPIDPNHIRIVFPIAQCPIDIVMENASEIIRLEGGKKASDWVGLSPLLTKRGRNFLTFIGYGHDIVLKGDGYDFKSYNYGPVETSKLTAVPYGVLEGYTFTGKPTQSRGLAGMLVMSIQQPNTANCTFGGSCPYDLYLALNSTSGKVSYCQFDKARNVWACFQSQEEWVNFDTIPKGILVNKIYQSVWDLYRQEQAAKKSN